MARTDAHRPSAISPTDYDFVACDYYGGAAWESNSFSTERRAFNLHRERTGGKYNENQSTGTCHICGANALYVAKYHHRPSNTYIVTGMDCAAKMDMDHPEVFKSFRKRVAKVREFARGQQRARNVLICLGMSVALEMYDATDKAGQTKGERIITDMVGKLARYGSLSGAQVAFLDKLIRDRDLDGRARQRPRQPSKRSRLPRCSMLARLVIG